MPPKFIFHQCIFTFSFILYACTARTTTYWLTPPAHPSPPKAQKTTTTTEFPQARSPVWARRPYAVCDCCRPTYVSLKPGTAQLSTQRSQLLYACSLPPTPTMVFGTLHHPTPSHPLTHPIIKYRYCYMKNRLCTGKAKLTHRKIYNSIPYRTVKSRTYRQSTAVV